MHARITALFRDFFSFPSCSCFVVLLFVLFGCVCCWLLGSLWAPVVFYLSCPIIIQTDEQIWTTMNKIWLLGRRDEMAPVKAYLSPSLLSDSINFSPNHCVAIVDSCYWWWIVLLSQVPKLPWTYCRDIQETSQRSSVRNSLYDHCLMTGCAYE